MMVALTGLALLVAFVLSVVWVYLDARELSISSPMAWVVFCVVFSLVGFPLYLMHRRSFAAARRTREAS
jgi:hypothetical protein